jgi:hypothetical protein
VYEKYEVLTFLQKILVLLRLVIQSFSILEVMMKKLSAPLVVFFSLLLCLVLGSTDALSMNKMTPRGNGNNVAPEIQNNSQLRPYVPQRNFVQIHESNSHCDFSGNHIGGSGRPEYNCVDYRGENGLWRVIFGPGLHHTRLARKIFKKDHGDWVLLAEFDTANQLVFESPSGTKVRIASGVPQERQDGPKQASGNENASPLQDVIPPELKKLLPGLGTLLGK